MQFRTVEVQQAVGMVLCHDITRIVRGESKGPLFRKGHVVRVEDIPHLLNVGKEHLYVYEINDAFVHEDDAALRIALATAGENIRLEGPKEGKIELLSTIDGLVKVDIDNLYRINDEEQMMFASIHNNRYVKAGAKLAGTRIIPLVIDARKIKHVEEMCLLNGPILRVLPTKALKTGIVTTGSEVFHGRIVDAFGPVLQKKSTDYGFTILRQAIVDDSVEQIADAIHGLLAEGAELILVTGGMSVDPDDLSPTGIKAAGGHVVTYGAPALPGAMLMLAYIGDVPILGLPGCVMYHGASVFDLVLPRLLAGESLKKSDIVALGHGGLCTACPSCHFPDCAFGKSE
jgi:molybdenum cofactor synthesis domain-containing protein